jgi:hypothetical protein
MNVHDDLGQVIAAIGLRRADEGALFLENYLKQPVEKIVEKATGGCVRREEIVEIGNLASAGKGASVFLFVTLAAYLRQQNLAYAVVTATKSLRRSFALFGFEFVEIAAADPSVLPDSGASWGSYYNNDPKVLVGAILPAFSRLEPLSSTVPQPRPVSSCSRSPDRMRGHFNPIWIPRMDANPSKPAFHR